MVAYEASSKCRYTRNQQLKRHLGLSLLCPAFTSTGRFQERLTLYISPFHQRTPSMTRRVLLLLMIQTALLPLLHSSYIESFHDVILILFFLAIRKTMLQLLVKAGLHSWHLPLGCLPHLEAQVAKTMAKIYPNFSTPPQPWNCRSCPHEPE